MMADTNNGKPGLTADINANIELIKSTFKDDETLITRFFENQADSSIQCCTFYTDSMVDNKLFNEDVVKPIQEYKFKRYTRSDFIDIIDKQIMLSDSVDKTSDMGKIIQAIVYGDTVLLASGCSDALILNTKGWPTRSIEEPDGEKVLRGPREGFTEAILVNLTMLRRRLRTQDLKIKYRTFGARTQTKGCLCYLEGVVNKNVLAELERRLDLFSLDGVLDSNYLSEFISDAPRSPIDTVGSTERPDVVAAKLLEGRVAIFLDGTPVALTVPHLFIEHFQSCDDYYLNYFFASIGRLLRILGFFISISTPAIYVALTTFHQEMLPTSLLMSIAIARQGVPLPTVMEAFIMLIVFEILRETGARMPSSIGQSLSIVGALVIGQSAVDAKLVSAPMIIVVAISGITGLLIIRLKGAIIIFRFMLLALSAITGLYGYIFGMMGLLIYLLSIDSFGIPIITEPSVSPQECKDIYIRAPWWFMINRPKFAADPKRNNSDGDPE
ncbi:spore germination protein [Ethanoligenens sp.]|uniref:spore germination protein n=1 Tax=Ethanoligenens sp. TaxID=2099655 RepID=UPI0039E99AEB